MALLGFGMGMTLGRVPYISPIEGFDFAVREGKPDSKRCGVWKLEVWLSRCTHPGGSYLSQWYGALNPLTTSILCKVGCVAFSWDL